MKKYNLKDFEKGWFIGNFKPTILNSKKFEIAVKYYKPGESEDSHYHKKATEYTIIAKGKVMMFNKIFKKGDIVKVKPLEKTSFIALKKTITVVIKTPSITNDKYLN